MAVRQQQRRGTAAQWTAANPILSAAEIGFEIDTNKFKIGDGINRWADLVYFTADAAAALEGLIDGAPDLLNTLNELAAAIGDDANFVTTMTTNLAAKAPLASPTFTGTVSGVTKSMVGLGNVDNTSDANKPVSTATQAALDLKANSADITELSQDAVNSALTAGSGITKTYNDSANTITVAVDSTIATKTYADGKASDAQAAAISAAATDATTKANAAKTYADGLISTEVTNRNSAITSAVAGVVGAAPAALDTLKELADALTADESTAASLATLVGTKAPSANPTFTGTVQGITKSMVGLGNVDNTSDANKPVSTATQTALDAKLASATAASTYETISNVALKAPLASPTFTGTVSGITKSMVGLGNVDNTSDSSKPISALTQTALDAKLGSTTAAATYATIASPTFTGTVSGITKSMVGLGNVDNTADSAKPISTATQAALDLKANLTSPALTGMPTAPTASYSTDSTQLATTAFVKSVLNNIGSLNLVLDGGGVN
jgi:hypothetical protein